MRRRICGNCGAWYECEKGLALSLEVDIEKKFRGFHLSQQFSAGDETLGLLGASGCGKSLTMRSIAGIEKPDAGKIIVNDTVFFDKAPGKKAKVDLSPQQRKTALLFQNYMLFPNLTIEQNVAAGLPKGVTAAERAEAIREQMQRFGLLGMEKRYPVQLSGGQQQRVALARMLAARPGILMLDEPFSALDSHLKSSLEQNLIGLFEQFKGTILYVSHDIDEAFRFCDRIAVMYLGSFVEIGTSDQIFNSPKHPYTQALISAIPRSMPGQTGKRIILAGDIPSPANPPKGCKFHTRCQYARPECSEIAPEKRVYANGHTVWCHLNQDA